MHDLQEARQILLVAVSIFLSDPIPSGSQVKKKNGNEIVDRQMIYNL